MPCSHSQCACTLIHTYIHTHPSSPPPHHDTHTLPWENQLSGPSDPGSNATSYGKRPHTRQPSLLLWLICAWRAFSRVIIIHICLLHKTANSLKAGTRSPWRSVLPARVPPTLVGVKRVSEFSGKRTWPWMSHVFHSLQHSFRRRRACPCLWPPTSASLVLSVWLCRHCLPLLGMSPPKERTPLLLTALHVVQLWNSACLSLNSAISFSPWRQTFKTKWLTKLLFFF